MSSTVGRLVVDVQTNKSGGAVAYGDVVINDTANDHAFTTTTTGGFTAGVVGVCIEPNGIANNATGRIQYQGYCPQVNANASVTRGYFLKTHTVAKQATGSATRGVGSFGVALKTSTTPDAVLWGFPDASSAAGNVATDPIWDVAGDLAVGTGADTAARLAIGAAGGRLARINGAIAWDSGTSFPTAAAGDRYWRTDRGRDYYYDGTRWLTIEEFALVMPILDGLDPQANAVTQHYAAVDEGENGAWLTRAKVTTLVMTTNDGTKYWTLQLMSGPGTGAAVALGSSFNTSADTAGTNTVHTVTIGAAVTAGHTRYQITYTKTSTPGTIYTFPVMFYRLIG